MKIAVIGDMHLGRTSRGYASTPDVVHNWYLFLDEAKEWGADIVVQTGDLFDGSTPDPDLVALSIRLMRGAAEMFPHGVLVYPGNHDLRHGKERTDAMEPIRAAGIENIHCPRSVACYNFGGGKGLLALPYESKSRRQWDSSESYDKLIVKTIAQAFPKEIPRLAVFGHCDIEGASVTTESLARGGGHQWPDGNGWNQFVTFAVNGHYHLPHDVQFGNWHITNVGTPARLDFGEAKDEKRWLTLSI